LKLLAKSRDLGSAIFQLTLFGGAAAAHKRP
jgi:hypothetical protein